MAYRQTPLRYTVHRLVRRVSGLVLIIVYKHTNLDCDHQYFINQITCRCPSDCSVKQLLSQTHFDYYSHVTHYPDTFLVICVGIISLDDIYLIFYTPSPQTLRPIPSHPVRRSYFEMLSAQTVSLVSWDTPPCTAALLVCGLIGFALSHWLRHCLSMSPCLRIADLQV